MLRETSVSFMFPVCWCGSVEYKRLSSPLRQRSRLLTLHSMDQLFLAGQSLYRPTDVFYIHRYQLLITALMFSLGLTLFIYTDNTFTLYYDLMLSKTGEHNSQNYSMNVIESKGCISIFKWSVSL